MKRPCTLDGAKMHEQGNTPNSVVEKTYHRVVLVRRAWEVVEKAREAEVRNDKKKRSGKGKHKASSPLLPMEKRKKRARVVSPAVVTAEVESEENEEDKVHRLAPAIEANKAVPGGDDLVGPSCQAKAPQDVGNWQEDVEQEEEAEVRLEAAPQVHPWGKELPQWSWLPEWGTSDPVIWDMSSGDKQEL
ncbi:hypothetical protein C0993_003615 [Termitomyces sp. T159_Od127]|nr:hypothetical protein C0993_003615 [Termitomyces sp. T159_Od127]